MWWEYVIIFGILLGSIVFLVRHFLKKMSGPGCESPCAGCKYNQENCCTRFEEFKQLKM